MSTDTRQALAALVSALEHAAMGYAQDPQDNTSRRLNDARAKLLAALSAQPVEGAAPAPEPSRCTLGCVDECKAKMHGCASECPALPWQPTAPEPSAQGEPTTKGKP